MALLKADNKKLIIECINATDSAAFFFSGPAEKDPDIAYTFN